MCDNKFISNAEMILILEKKYIYEVSSYGESEDKNISIFKNWIWLFNSLIKLEEKARHKIMINEDSFKDEDIINLFLHLSDVSQKIFSYNHEISFELFMTYKLSLEIYNQQNSGFGKYKFLHRLNVYEQMGFNFPIQACLKFFFIFLDQLEKKINKQDINKKNIIIVGKDLNNLYNSYGNLYTINITYRLKLSPYTNNLNVISKSFYELRLIEQQIISDNRLLKVFFKFEDDGLHGCLLNCILIYPAQIFPSFGKVLTNLEQISENCSNTVQINFQNWGQILNIISRKEVVGLIDDREKLDNFLYWTIGSFYRHDDFFCYKSPLENGQEFLHEQVSECWKLSLDNSKAGFKQKILKITHSQLMSYISDPLEVWSIKVLSTDLQKKLMIDNVVLSEISHDIFQNRRINNDFPYCMQVFYTFLSVGAELFFHFERYKDIITGFKPSRLGCQLIYIFNFLCQEPNACNDIKELNHILGNRFQKLLNSQLWLALEKSAKTGVTAIDDIESLHNFNLLRNLYEEKQLGARVSGFDSYNISDIYTDKDLLIFNRRTVNAQKYLEALLKKIN